MDVNKQVEQASCEYCTNFSEYYAHLNDETYNEKACRNAFVAGAAYRQKEIDEITYYFLKDLKQLHKNVEDTHFIKWALEAKIRQYEEYVGKVD